MKMKKKLLIGIPILLILVVVLFGQTGNLIRMFDTGYVYYLTLMWDEAGAADRTINFAVNGGNRTLDMTGNLTVESASFIDQDLTADKDVTFLGVLTTGTEGIRTGSASNLGKVVIYDGSSNTVTITAQAIAGNYTLTLPTTDGGAGEYLKSDGSGSLSWDTPGGAGDMTKAVYDADIDSLIDQDAGGTELDTSGVTENQILVGTAGNLFTLTNTPTFPSVIITDGGTVGQAAGPLITFDDTNNFLEITGANVGIGTSTPGALLDVLGSGDASVQMAKYFNPDVTTDGRLTYFSWGKSTAADGYAAFLVHRFDTTPGDEAVGLYLQGSAFGDGITVNTGGHVGIETDKIPHGGIGYAKLAIDGTNASALGSHVQFTTASDDYPLMQILNWQHDSVRILFDSYYDGAEKSSDAGSNFQILKSSDLFKIQYDSGVAQGGVVTWNEGLSLDTSGNIYVRTSNAELRFYEAANYVGFEAPALAADQIWVLPAADGNVNDVLTTDSAGNLSWTVKGGGGAATDVWKTINAPAGTDPVASGIIDTLNLTTGSANLTITGNSGTDTVAFDFSATPTFTSASLGTGELTAGSINRGAGTLTIEIGGTAEISTTSAASTFGGNIILSGTVDGIDIATDVGANTTHRGSVGTDHSDVGDNNNHRLGTGADHSWIDQNVTIGQFPSFDGIGTAGDADILDLNAGSISVDGTIFGLTITATTAVTGPNVTSGVDPGHTHSVASLDIENLLSLISDLEERVLYLENMLLKENIK